MTTQTPLKRLTVDMTPEEHRRLKTLAAFHGVTMKDYLLGKALSEVKLRSLEKSRKVAETDYLLKNPINRKRLLKATSRSRNKDKEFSSLKELKYALGI